MIEQKKIRGGWAKLDSYALMPELNDGLYWPTLVNVRAKAANTLFMAKEDCVAACRLMNDAIIALPKEAEIGRNAERYLALVVNTPLDYDFKTSNFLPTF